jgi:peptidoglycan/xylan/chitin deacetylase (PgdA/CDA1 family)
MYKIPILMYHSIETPNKSDLMKSIFVKTSSFHSQMRILKILGYKGLSMNQLYPYLTGEKSGKVVGITFDDGYKNNLINASIILKKYGHCATCYLVSDYIGKYNLWDKKNGIRALPLMNYEEVNLWLKDGNNIGCHTKTHIDLTKISSSKIIDEITHSKSRLEKEFQQSIDHFCYPYGKYNQEITKIVKESGFKTATSSNRGVIQNPNNLFELKRIPITFHTLPHLFLIKLLSKYEERRFDK